METARMIDLVRGLAEAKSRQDVCSALRFCDINMVLEAPAFGTRACGFDENKKALTRFFDSFPDYAVALDGSARDGDVLVCWGTVRMTMTGNRFGVTPNGKRAVLPVFIRFTFTDVLIASEIFFFDLSALCEQSGVSTDAVRKSLFGDEILAGALFE